MKLLYRILDIIALILWCILAPIWANLSKQNNPLDIPVFLLLALFMINSIIIPKITDKEVYDGYYVAIRVLLFLLPDIFVLIKHFLF